MLAIGNDLHITPGECMLLYCCSLICHFSFQAICGPLFGMTFCWINEYFCILEIISVVLYMQF